MFQIFKRDRRGYIRMAGRPFSTYWFFYQEEKRKIPGGWKRKTKKELGKVKRNFFVVDFSFLGR